ncbi:MAG: Holliday junction resolvase RuvX [Planctomycetes bacterium]|nr:Holliday junction resolvase RuvX [Planctomycetota bacterium]
MMVHILGIDYGSKRIGCAIGDLETGIAFGLPLLDGVADPTKDAMAVAALADAQGADRIVVGLPKTMAGEEGPAAAGVMAFVERLRAAVAPRPVETWDERLTSAGAERALRHAGADLGRKKKREQVNTMAAQMILQGWIDAHRRA